MNELCVRLEQLGDQLLNAKHDQERVARLSKFLRARVDGARAEDLLVTQTLQLIRTDIWSIRVPQLLKRLHVSERHLERRFVRAIGVSPHQYIRILRFREALHLMKAGQFDRLSDVAYDLNYVDQSHFIKDTKALSGYTPRQLVPKVEAGVKLSSAEQPRSRSAYLLENATTKCRHCEKKPHNSLLNHDASKTITTRDQANVWPRYPGGFRSVSLVETLKRRTLLYCAVARTSSLGLT